MFLLTMCTSLVFLTNALAAWMQHEIIYASCWVYLVIASLFFHAYRPCQVFYWLDQLGIFCMFLCGLVLTIVRYKERTIAATLGIIASFSLSIYMYYIGYIHQTMCFSPDEDEREYTHGLLHYICSLGHHCVLL